MLFEQDFEKMLRQYQSSINDKKRFSALIKDLFPENQKNVNLLLMVYNMGIVEEIEKVVRINNTFAFRFVKQLIDDFGLSRSNADWIVSVWCVCYGKQILGKECDIQIQKQGAGPAIIEEKQTSSGTQYGDLFVYKRCDHQNGLSVAGFNGAKMQTIIFQNMHGINPVVEISDNSFENSSIEEAIITEGISSIGRSAFKDCKSLHQVIMPMSMKELGDHSFENCDSLKSVSLPAMLEKVGNNAFKGTGLRTICIPQSVYWMGEGVFAECEDINNVKIPDNIDRITKGMFERCSSLKKIELHDNLIEIEDRAFMKCGSLDYIVIPDSVKKIGQDAFTGTDKQFIIQCSFGSYAESYCRANRIKYQLV